MANSATVGALRVLLSADTAQFDKALAGADASTKKLANTMKRDLEPSQARVNSLIRQFAGTKEIGQAEAYAKAIGDISNANKLTAKHQADTNAAMQKALAHYKAIGQQAPAHFKALEQATRGATASTVGLGSSISTIGSKLTAMAGLFGVTFGAAAIGGFVKSVFDAAEKVVDLSNKMGVSIEAAQRFQYAARQSGAEIEDVSRAIVKMNDNLAEGDKGTVKALSDVGLSFDKIRAMKPEVAFRAIADAIQKIPDPMRQTQVAMELFGKSGAEILPMIRDGSLAAADGIKVMSEETAKRLEQAKQDWENFWNGLTIISAGALVTIMDEWNKMIADVTRGTKFMASLSNPGMAVALGFAEHLGEKDAARQKPKDINLPVEVKAIRELTAEQKAQSEALKRMAKQAEQSYQDWLAALVGLSKAEKQQLEFEKRAIHEGHLPYVLSLMKIEDTVSGIVEKQMNSKLAKSIMDVGEAAKRTADKITAAQRVADSGSLIRPIEGLFGKSLSVSDLMKGVGASKPATAAVPMLEVMNQQLARSSQLMNALASSSNGAFRMVAKVIGFASDSVLDLASAFKAAKGNLDAFANSTATMNAGMSFATLGLSMVISDLQQSAAASELFRQKQIALRKEVQALGVTMAEFDAIRANAIKSGPQGFWRLTDDKILKLLQDAKGKIDDLTSSAEQFGGVLPKSLQDAAKQMLNMAGMTGNLRKEFEKLIGAPSWKVLQERADALGIDKGALGAGFNQAKTKDLALGFVRDLQMFADAGADADAVLRGMSDELSTLLVEAMKTGAALPKTLEPYLKRLSEMGLLLDENGNAIDMGALSFADFEDEALEAMKDLLTEIKDILAKAFPAAADAAAKAIGKIGDAFRWPGAKQPEAGSGGSISPWMPPILSPTSPLSPDLEMAYDGSVGLSQQQQTSTFIFSFDERALARSTVSYIPGETKRLGLNRV